MHWTLSIPRSSSVPAGEEREKIILYPTETIRGSLNIGFMFPADSLKQGKPHTIYLCLPESAPGMFLKQEAQQTGPQQLERGYNRL